MQSKMFLYVVSAGLSGLWTGCSSPASRTPVYTQSEIGQAISQQAGEVISARDVIIAPNSTASRGAPGAGSRVGAAAMIGAITGSPVAIANAVGSVVGETGGSKLDNKMGEEITVQLKGGPPVTVVQERGSVPMSPGDQVLVLTTGSATYGQKVRVVRQAEDPDAPIGSRPQ